MSGIGPRHGRRGRETGFDHLVSPGRIGGLVLPNRVVMAAMDMGLSRDGMIDEREVAHFVARARGGAGLVTTGACAVAYPEGATSRKQPGLSDDRFLPGLRLLAGGVHSVGGRVCVQLVHHGKVAAVDVADGRPLLVASKPNRRPDLTALVDATASELKGLGAAREGGRDRYAEASEEDLARVVRAFGEAAARVRSAGIDAVEVHAGHGYLLCGFLSGGYNRRVDRWGGPLVNRARLTCEVVAEVRRRVGPDYPVLVKLDGLEFSLPRGMVAQEAADASRLFVEAGADALTVSGYSDDVFSGFTDGPLPSGPGAYRAAARAVKEAVAVPVVAVGRISPELGEEMLARGECDFVALGRQLLADPDLPAKIRTGRRASVRPCINCYVCVAQNFVNETPRCAVNPSLEHQGPPELPLAGARRTVVVVGGGPAGMEAARVAAVRGHRVTLLERNDRLGGTALFSRLTAPANGPLVDWLEHELAAEGVEVRTGTAATAAEVRRLDPDVVVVATGAGRDRPDVPGTDLPHVLTGDELRSMLVASSPAGAPVSGTRLTRAVARAVLGAGRRLGVTHSAERVRRLSRWWMPLGRHVAVVGGGLVGLEVAEFLAERGRSVTLLEDGPTVGLPMALPRRLAAVAGAFEHGVEIVRGATVVAVDETAVVYRVGTETRRALADNVVLATGVRPDGRVADELSAAGFDVRVIGDAAEVGYLEGAIHSAWRVAGDI